MAEFTEVIREHGRMCSSYANCKGCPLHSWDDCGNLCDMSDDRIDQFEQIVMGWSKEHPEQPTVDAVPVVRCRDCKYFELDHLENIEGTNIRLITGHEICTKWGKGCKTNCEGYCFLGERREV